MKQNFLGPAIVTALAPTVLREVLDRVLPHSPVEVSVPAKTEAQIRAEVLHQFEQTFSDRILTDPVARNELNAEPLRQSRVIVGNTGASVGVVIYALVNILSQVGIDIPSEFVETTVEGISAVLVIWGIGYSIYGRIKTGLKPLGVK